MSSLDAAPPPAALPAFDDCADALLEQAVLLSPAELHGAACGLLGGGFQESRDAALAALEQTLAIDLRGRAAEQAMELLDSAASLFEAQRWDFQPLLPDDDLELAQRVAALAAWCRGFLGGYAQARVSAGTRERPVAADSAEALRDFAAIAQAGVEDEEPQDDDTAEQHYMELVEYLRVAVLSIAADSGAAAHNASAAEPDAGRRH